MFFAEFLFAMIFAFVITLLFTFVFRRSEGWPILLFFVIVLLGAWAGGVWLEPLGPTINNIYWLPFLVAALFAALFLTLVPPPEPRRIVIRPSKTSEERGVEAVLDIFFWILILLLLAAIFFAYFD